MQQYAIIVAGGTGTRMNNAMPKQFLPLQNKPILYYSIHAFVRVFPDIHIVLVMHKDYIKNVHAILIQFKDRIDLQIVEGGTTRFDSVKNGLACVPDNEESIVYVHDAARPFINTQLLQSLQKDCIANGNAIPVMPINESVRMQTSATQSAAVDRSQLRLVQTPQVFKSIILKKAFLQNYQVAFTDEATVCELDGATIFLSKGIEENIKITTPNQLLLAERMMLTWEVD
jgi:2-C-methyl-D-erythritol 4-phosphate cytidylyltransferase